MKTEEKIQGPYALPDGWKWVRLGDVAEWGSGGTPSRKHPEYYHGNIPWIKTGELNNDVVTDSEEKITEKALKHSSAKLYPVNTVMIAMYGATIGKVGIMGIPATTNQACACAVCTKDIQYKYLFYYLMSQKAGFILHSKGGAQPNISQEILKKYYCPLAPLAEQREIVRRVDDVFAKEQKVQNAAQTALEQVGLMKRAVLARAFRGEL